MTADAHPAASVWRSPLRQLLVLSGLTGFAISQPLLSILGDNPSTLSYHGVNGSAVVVLAALVALGPPLVLWLIVVLAMRWGGRGGRGLYLLVVGTLVGLFTIQLAKGAGLEQPWALATAAVAAAAGFVVAYVRVPLVAWWAACTGALPVLAAAFFVLASPASALLESADAPERIAGGEQPSVVFILLDELPTRSLVNDSFQIDAARFPNFAALAEDATWYRHYTTLASLTEAAVPSVLSGTVPNTDPPLWANHPDNLFTLLAPTHELEVLESATHLCPYDSCGATPSESTGEVDTGPGLGDLADVITDLWTDRVGLAPTDPNALAAFDDFEEDVAPVEDESTRTTAITTPEEAGDRESRGFAPDDDTMRATSVVRADALIDSFDAAKGPALYFLHLLLPHQPWRFRPDGELYAESDPFSQLLPEHDRDLAYSWSPWIGTVSEQRHLLQLGYTDLILGQMVEGLRSAGLYDDSLVIVTADHGVSFETGKGSRGADESTLDALAYAPLFIKPPGQSHGGVDDSNLTAIDLVPTVADLLAIDLPWDTDGVPAGSPAIAARGDTKVFYDMRGLGKLSLGGILEFEDGDTFPRITTRWLGDLVDPDDPLSALTVRLGLEHVIGRPLDDLDPTAGGEVKVEGLDALRRPPSGQARLGLVTGVVSDASEGAKLVLAIDGTVVAGSELSTDSEGQGGRFALLLPAGALGEDNDIRVALIADDEVTELQVR